MGVGGSRMEALQLGGRQHQQGLPELRFRDVFERAVNFVSGVHLKATLKATRLEGLGTTAMLSSKLPENLSPNRM